MAKQKRRQGATAPEWKKKQKQVRKKRRAQQQAAQQATKSRAVESSQRTEGKRQPWPTASHTDIPWEKEKYRFLNPYNFVRYLPAPKPIDVVDYPLGRCSPPPHDRYVGLSGRITCTLEAMTPLFVSDSHDVKTKVIPDENGVRREHRSYRFFQVNGEDAIPATSLRGMIRSVFEAATNSCFGVFDPSRRLDYREVSVAKEMRAAIVTKIPQDESECGEVALCEDARVPTYTDDPKVDPDAWKCGERGYTILSKSGKTAVERVVKERSVYENDERPVATGWLKITGQTFPGKKHERFFYYPEGEKKATKVPFAYARMQDYNAVLREQISDKTRQFRTNYQNSELTVGDLVYVLLDAGGKTVSDISLVKVPRLRYHKSLADMIPSHLHPCTTYDNLCPACRVFGWVKDISQQPQKYTDQNERVAYAGRTRFSIGELIEDQGVYAEEMCLAILSSPKPTTAQFYLLKGKPSEANGTPPEGDQKAAYRDGYKLRGRKFYRHFGQQLNRQEYERKGNTRDHQNRSVRGVRTPGNVFRFIIDFENLNRIELGALLWSLDLGGDGFHRIGYGKPLGFGSVRITLEEVELIDWQQRLQSLDESPIRHRATANERNRWRADWAQAMQNVYGRPLEELGNIRDLRALLLEPADLPIHYPRMDTQPSPDGKNFEWFVENKRKAQNDAAAGPHHALALADRDTEGLPLLRTQKIGHQ